MLKKIAYLATLIIYSQASLAFFCPNNFNQIELGNTRQQVEAACGKPKLVEEREKKKQEPPQEWSYFILVHAPLYTDRPGTTKVSMAFDHTGKMINMNINGINRSASNFCNGTVLHIGDTRDKVKKSCGDPAYVSIGRPETNAPPEKPVKITEYVYDASPGRLIFENNVLVERR